MTPADRRIYKHDVVLGRYFTTPVLPSPRSLHLRLPEVERRMLTQLLAEPYNFAALGADQHAGALHPLNKMRQEFRLVRPAASNSWLRTSHANSNGLCSLDKSSSSWGSLKCLRITLLRLDSGYVNSRRFV